VFPFVITVSPSVMGLAQLLSLLILLPTLVRGMVLIPTWYQTRFSVFFQQLQPPGAPSSPAAATPTAASPFQFQPPAPCRRPPSRRRPPAAGPSGLPSTGGGGQARGLPWRRGKPALTRPAPAAWIQSRGPATPGRALLPDHAVRATPSGAA
jgi:hypothetical protein